MLSPSKFKQFLEQHFPYTPTEDQEALFGVFANFFTNRDPLRILVLQGYAGTGKTSFVRAVVKAVSYTAYKTVLLAPTGRSAKVLNLYAQKPATTIHKKIYYTSNDKATEFQTKLKANKHKKTLFIVDEASMIADDHFSSNVLEDLIEYVYSGQDCFLMLIGDPAQLPPVGLSDSPALSENALSYYADFTFFKHSLQSVMRQHEQSGILQNADYLQEAISEFGLENTLVITRSNKRAVLYNQAIRQRILYKENTLESGELLMVVKNNYYYLSDDDSFLANGEIIEIQQIVNYYDFYGFRFAEAEIRLIDAPDTKAFTAILLLDTLESNTAALTQEDTKRLWEEVAKDYADILNKRERIQAIKTDKFYNAIQVKYAYALTCHKTQGGQWDAVFIDYPWLPPEQPIDTDYMRWLYTACTRAVKKLYLVNFKDEFFEK